LKAVEGFLERMIEKELLDRKMYRPDDTMFRREQISAGIKKYIHWTWNIGGLCRNCEGMLHFHFS
jgi:hypothetical protein